VPGQRTVDAALEPRVDAPAGGLGGLVVGPISDDHCPWCQAAGLGEGVLDERHQRVVFDLRLPAVRRVEHHAVERGVGERQPRRVTPEHLEPVVQVVGEVLAGARGHLRLGVEADHLAPDQPGLDEDAARTAHRIQDVGLGAGAEADILDPMCGTGGVLVEAGLVGSEVIGLDAQPKMAAGARENLAHYLDDGFEVLRGDATRLPFADAAFDGVVFDAPYGRQSKVEHDSLVTLVEDALAEARRLAPRAVVVGDRPYDEAAEAAGWSVDSRFERRVHRSLTRHVHVLR